MEILAYPFYECKQTADSDSAEFILMKNVVLAEIAAVQNYPLSQKWTKP